MSISDGHYGWLLDMDTRFDDFSPKSLAYPTDCLSAERQANGALLRSAKEGGGPTPCSGEWWHFDGLVAKNPRAILEVPVN